MRASDSHRRPLLVTYSAVMSPNVDRDLLDAAAAAVLLVYRADGSALTSPVWFRADSDAVEIVIAEGDAKLARLRADPRCVFMAFETAPPFRGLRIEGIATLSDEGLREARLEIASRYLGEAEGRRYVEQRTKPGLVVRLPLADARSWDLRSTLPK
jgi:Pyridoxamine 5'-phosphate oxidase